MKTIISIFLPWIANELLAQKLEEEPKKVLLYSSYRGQKIVVRGFGAAPQTKLTDAKAHLNGAVCIEYKPHQEELILEKLIKSLSFISPAIAQDKQNLPYLSADCPDVRHVGINIDATASVKLFKGADNIVCQIKKKLNGYYYKLAAAPSLGAAWAISRYSKDRILLTDQRNLKHHIAHLPAAALRLDNQALKVLDDLGLHTVSSLLKLPRNSLLKRFGPELSDKIDYLLNIKEEPINTVHFEAPDRKVFVFSSPVCDKEPITYRFEILLKKILDSRKDRLICALGLELIRVDLPPFVKSVSLSTPSANFDFIWSLLKQELESIEIGDGVDEVSLFVTDSSYPKYMQTNSFAKSSLPQRYEEHRSELLDKLSQKIGRDNVLYAAPKASHWPENKYLFSTLNNSTETPSTKADRPSKLFSPPQKIRAMGVMPDKPPFWIRWNNDKLTVKQGLGPERIEQEWWTTEKEEKREYFTIQVETGLWLWVYREMLTNTWYVHGIWA